MCMELGWFVWHKINFYSGTNGSVMDYSSPMMFTYIQTYMYICTYMYIHITYIYALQI